MRIAEVIDRVGVFIAPIVAKQTRQRPEKTGAGYGTTVSVRSFPSPPS
jgi:hypothetical protein